MSSDIKFSPNMDIQPTEIKDLVPERLIRLYPYELVDTDKSKSFIQGNSVTIAAISQLNLDLDGENLKTDEDGHRYFEMLAGITSDAKLDYSSQTSVYGQELKEEDSFTCLSNWFYERELEEIKVGNMRFTPAVFTVGKPFNKDDYETGEQAMFIATSIVEAKEGQAQYAFENLNPEGLYEFVLVNTTVLESSYTSARIFFSENLGNHLLTNEQNLLPITDPSNDGITFPGISLEFQTKSLLSRVTARGKARGYDSDIDLQTVEGLTPIKASPIETQDKLTMYMDWFDYDMVMPQYVADLFNVQNGITIESLKSVTLKDQDGNDETVELLGDFEIQLIRDMLSYSTAFADSFSQFERNATGSDAGKIKSDQTIGVDKAKLVALEGKDSVKVMDALYEKYIRTALPDKNSIKFKTLNQILVSLSRYINSSYVIGKGLTSFGEVYLPWYIKPVESLSLEISGSNWEIKPDIKYILDSNWFDLEDGTGAKQIAAKYGIDISKVKMVQAERKLTLPEVPDTIQPINKLTKPGDMSTTTSKDLMYYWYLPVQNYSVGNLFLNTPNISTNHSGDRQVDTGWTDFGHLIPADKTKFIQEKVAAQLNVREAEVQVKSIGTEVEQTSATAINLPSADLITYLGSLQSFNKWGSAVAKVSKVFHPTNTKMPRDKMLQALSIYTGYPEEAIEIISQATYGFESISGGSYSLKRFRLINNDVTVTAQRTSEININRDVVYDKINWQWYVSDVLNVNSDWYDVHLIEPRSLDIQKIDEISISQIWGNSVRVHIGVDTIEVPLFNKDDETIGVQRILFT